MMVERACYCALTKKVKSSANSEDESEDDQTSVWHHIAKEVHLA